MAKSHTASMPNIIIIGAGIQGISVALALAHRGITSTILEGRSAPMRGASYGNEGKIHLGFVYALDKSGDTGMEMLRGAHSFAPLLNRWCGELAWQDWISPGFLYGIMPDSMATPESLQNYYEQLRSLIPEATADLPVKPSYFGKPVSWLWKNAPDAKGAPRVNDVPVTSIFTEEVAVDVRLFAPVLMDIVQRTPEISIRTHTRVNDVEQVSNGYKLNIQSGDKTSSLVADTVINCAWYDRTRLDRMVFNDMVDVPLSYRVKHRVIVQPRSKANDLRPVTMVQGPYGDVSPYTDGTVYLSWYPECRTYFEQQPPPEEISNPDTLAAISERTLEQMSQLFPDLLGAKILSCSPGIIVAEGTKDVHDPDSELHRRTSTGPRGGNGWWSVDTGKLTLAPLHGETTAQLVQKELELTAKTA